jgi:hypothetical protein
MVGPLESTAGYKNFHLPVTRQYVSSTRHDRLVFRSRRGSAGFFPVRSVEPSTRW